MPTSKKTPAKKPLKKSSIAAANAEWREELLAQVRTLIQQALPDAIEEVKWRKPSNGMRGVPVWSHGGIICTGESYKHAVKLTFARGAALEDPAGLFNASLEGGARRAIDLHEGDMLNAQAFKALIRDAADFNASSKPEQKPAAPRTKKKVAKTATARKSR